MVQAFVSLPARELSMSIRPATSSRVTRALSRLGVLSVTLSLGACAQMGDLGLGSSSEPASLASAPASAGPQSDLEKATAYWADKVAKEPKDGKAILAYVRNLKALDRKQDALSVLQSGYLYNSVNREYLSEYGRLALELDQIAAASQILERADDPAHPDWRVISARGTALAKQHQFKESIPFFERARLLAPEQASLMNNLAMAYAMDGQAEKAEALLRQAQASNGSDKRVVQNLALVLSLQGKHSESRALTGEGEPADASPAVGLASDPGPNAPRRATPAVARGRQTAPVLPVSSQPLDADDIIRAAMAAEVVKSRPAGAASSKKKQTAEVTDQPALRASSR